MTARIVTTYCRDLAVDRMRHTAVATSSYTTEQLRHPLKIRSAERAERALRWLCGAVEHIHLLGLALRSVKMLRWALRQCERQGTAVSFDTASYRRAPNQHVKKQLGDRWMPRSREETVVMLETWLRQALVL